MKNHIVIRNKINNFTKKIKVSSDKSISIRCVLLASQAVGISKLSNLLESEDVLNTLKTIKKLGISYKKKGNVYYIYGFGLNGFNTEKKVIIDAGNSGTLARLILGLLVKSRNKVKLIGDKSLSKRDFSRVIKPLKLFGANIKSRKNLLPIEILGTEYLRPIFYKESIGSAQVKSSLIFAALNTPGISIINSKKSRNHTELMLKFLKYPINVVKKKEYDLISVKGLNQINNFEYNIPGDISSASFFIVLTLLSKKSNIVIENVNIKVNLEEEKRNGQFILHLFHEKLISSAHDVSDGGIAITLCELAIVNDIGFIVTEGSTEYFFNETQARYIVTINPSKEKELISLAKEKEVHLTKLGVAKGTNLCFGQNFLSLAHVNDLYQNVINNMMDSKNI